MLEFIDRTVIPFFLGLYDAIGYVGVGLAIALETFVPIIPSEVIVPMAGWKVSQSAADPSVLEPLTGVPWSFVAALLVATVGAVAGSLAGYLIGAWGGRPLLDRWGRYVHIHPDDLDRADAWFARYGDWAVFFGRLVPLVRALINYPAGVARMPVGRFLLFSALGSLPWNAALLLAGFILGENYERLYDAVRPYELVIYALVVIGTAFVIYRWLSGRGRADRAAA
jgi:membrane protein DedA with SNARE-associated domain